MYHGREAPRKINPKEEANIFSVLTFFFTWDLLKKGYKKDITADDIYDVPQKFRSNQLGDKMEKEWRKESQKPYPSMYRLLWACYGRYYLLLGLVQLVMRLLMVFLLPRVVGKLVNYFTTTTTLTKSDAIYYALLLVLLNVVNTAYNHNYQFWVTELAIQIKTALCSLIYRKSLRLTTKSMADIGVGKIVTLITKDVTSVDSAIIFLNDIWIGVILIVVIAVLMYAKVGVASLAGTLFLVMIIPLQVFLGKLTSSLRIKSSKMTDHRLQVTQEALSVIKTIKMYTWEKYLGLKIFEARTNEMKKIRQIYWTKATALVVGGLVINLTFYIIVMTYTHTGNNFTAEVSFMIWELLNGLRGVVVLALAIGVPQCADVVAAMHRIRKVLLSKEQPESVRESTSTPLIELQEVGVKIGDVEVLKDVRLKVESGLNFVAGRLGSGKSSLLKTILGDYPVDEGKLKVNGTLTYASEEPWLFPSSIRQNILFGQKYDHGRYHNVLKVCALEQDIDTFERGDLTLVEERGMNLSKGQQSRMSLARAVYCDSDIYLIDNCLSSLDSQVQKFVFTECIQKFLSNKIVVMVSHNEHQLKQAHNVIYMEHGTVKSNLAPEGIPEKEIGDLVREQEKIDDELIDDNYKDLYDEEADTPLLKDKRQHNIYHEHKKEGQVAYKVYGKYSKFGGGLVILVPLFAVFIAAQFMMSYSDKVVSKWSNIQQAISEQKIDPTNSTLDLEAQNLKALTLYSVAILASTSLLLFKYFAYFCFAARASLCVHQKMVSSVTQATMKFFDLHYIGNILNRFSKDLAMIDEILPFNMCECMDTLCRISGILLVILTVQWKFIFPAAVIFLVLFFLQRWYLPTGRSLKRLDAATRSPMVGHINASSEGLTTIRAYGTQDILKKEFDKHQDLFTSAFYMMQSTSRTFAYFLDMMVNFFTVAIVFRFVLEDKNTHAGNVGLAITQSLGLTGMLQYAVRQWADLENQMTSVERVLEYTVVEKEIKSGNTIEMWPTRGEITFNQVSLTYGKSKQYVLRDISCTINPGEKIGIVGRTGAGKSSLISVLFRLYHFEGVITIDNVDINTLSLTFLRSSIAIIPQDPILFTGTIRSNIDPFGLYTDDKIWNAVRTVNLKNLIPSLDYPISDGCLNLSSGQKQLICLARAMLGKSKIIVLDEATANVDPDTDVVLFNMITEAFRGCTVLTIAHRLHTVIYADKVMVVDKGQIVEFDDPNKLLGDTESLFYKMVAHANLLN